MGNAVHVISIAVYPKTAEDAAKLQAALPRLVDEDPTLGYRIDVEPECAILACTSEGHLEKAVDRLIRDSGAQVSVRSMEIAYRETITKTLEYDYTYKKRAGGAGQFARVKIRFEPLPRGSGFVFQNAVIGGSVPGDYAAAAGEGLREAARRGGVRCYPTIDFMATLIDGAYHDTDSNAQTFKTAGGACFREAMRRAGPRLLERIMTVLTPEDCMGDVIGDLNSRLGSISGMAQQGQLDHAVRSLRAVLGRRRSRSCPSRRRHGPAVIEHMRLDDRPSRGDQTLDRMLAQDATPRNSASRRVTVSNVVSSSRPMR